MDGPCSPTHINAILPWYQADSHQAKTCTPFCHNPLARDGLATVAGACGPHKPLCIRLQKGGGLATRIGPWLRLDVEQRFAVDTTAAPSSPWSVVQKPWAPLQQHNGTTWTVASMAERIEAAEAEPGDRLGEPSGEPMTCTSPS
jgi:hypothetical protein